MSAGRRLATKVRSCAAAILRVEVPPRIDRDERSEAQLHEGDRPACRVMWERAVRYPDRSYPDVASEVRLHRAIANMPSSENPPHPHLHAITQRRALVRVA